MKKVNPSQPMIHPVAGLPELFSKCKATKVAVVTDTLYYHYNCCNEYDITWGCAYRCLQTLLSNLSLSGFKDAILKNVNLELDDYQQIEQVIPSIYEIQVNLARVGNIEQKHVGSTLWIEPPNAAIYLRKCCKIPFQCDVYVFYKESKNVLPKDVQKKEQVPIITSRDELIELFWDHFEKYKTPIMIDDSIKAYCVAGIRTLQKTQLLRSLQKTQLLRFDPHEYRNVKLEDYERLIKEGKEMNTGIGVEWMDFENVFYAPRWMLALPKLPKL